MSKINIKHCYHYLCWLIICCWLVGCQSTNELPAPEQMVQTTWTPITTTSTPVLELTPEVTATLEPTSGLLPTNSPQPTTILTDAPLPTSTPLPWATILSGDFLVFDGIHEGLVTVYLLQPEGASFLLSEGWLIEGQALSPDNTKIVFDPDGSTRSFQSRPNQLALIDLTTGKRTLVQLLARPNRISWSADSQSFFYADIVELEGQEEFHLVSYDIETGKNNIVVNLKKAPDERWSWRGLSYSGRYHAFIIKRAGQFDVYTFDVETLVLQQVTNTPEVEVETLWSPSTEQLLIRVNHEDERSAFAHPPFVAHTLLVVDANGNNLTTLGDTYEVTAAGWSVDGQQIATINAGSLCLLATTTGMEQCPLQNTAFREQYTEDISSTLAWSLDNKWLVFYAYPLQGYPCPQLFLLDLSANRVIEIDQITCGASPVYWSK